MKSLTNVRIREARSLLVSRHYPGAYYLSGYAVECALKACVAKTIPAGWFPDKQLAQDAFTHDLARLFKVARLEQEFRKETRSEPKLELNWAVVKDWSVASRYRVETAAHEAKDMLAAVTARRYGVLTWIKARW